MNGQLGEDKVMQGSLLIAILTHEVSSKALDIAAREGIQGATTLPRRGWGIRPLRRFLV